MKPMILTVPAKPEWALVLRMAVAGVGGIYDLPVDLLEEALMERLDGGGREGEGERRRREEGKRARV